MRYTSLNLMMVVLAVCPLASGEPEDLVSRFSHPSGAELVDQTEAGEPGSHQVILGALEKVNHELEPEDAETIQGFRQSATWFLPQSRRTKKVIEQYRPQLIEQGELAFECRGRSCGSSSYWANRVFNKAVLYGPEQHQYYAVIRLAGGDYVSLYVGQRGTRKIYVHVVSIKKQTETTVSD